MSELPQGWAEAAVTEIVGLHDARRIPLNATQRAEMKGAFPYYGANGLVDHVNDYLFDGDFVLLAEDGGYFDDPSRGVAYEASGKFWVNNHAHILEPLGGISPRYLRYQLNAIDWMPFVGGSTRLKLTQGGLERARLPVPPLSEQRRIVAKIDSLTGKSRRARDHLDHIPRFVEKYKQAVLAAAFRGDLTREWREQNKERRAWQETQIGEIAEIVTGSTPPTKERGYYGGDYPFVKPGDLDREEPIHRTESSLTDAGMSVSRQLPPETVLVSCIGNLGKIGYLAVDGACNLSTAEQKPAIGRRKTRPLALLRAGNVGRA